MDYFWFWLIVFVVLITCEITTSALISIWFCGGALVALITSFLGFDFSVQLIVFVIVSLILLILTRPFAKKVMKKEILKTNVSTLIGKKAIVTKKINNNEATGEISVNGQIWTARCIIDDEVIEPSTDVVIEEIQGVKAIVKSI